MIPVQGTGRPVGEEEILVRALLLETRVLLHVPIPPHASVPGRQQSGAGREGAPSRLRPLDVLALAVGGLPHRAESENDAEAGAAGCGDDGVEAPGDAVVVHSRTRLEWGGIVAPTAVPKDADDIEASIACLG